jgi:hypothetical protein
MKIPTANIVVAFNQETMDRLFSSGATYKSLVAQLSNGEDDALLFSNVGNPNFVSFEHTLGLGGGMKMTLSFIDPKDEFERRFFTDNPAKLIQGFSNPQAEKTTAFITDKPDDVKQSQSEYSKEYVAQYKQELQRSIGERELFIAYGTGNNIDLWSGPHRTVLTNADISVEGAKKITITLTPTSNAFDIGSRRGAYNEKINLNLQGLKIRCEGTSQEIKFTQGRAYNPSEYLTNISTPQSVDDAAFNALAELGYEELLEKLGRFDFHAMVVDAIRSYVQKATSNKNVIVLLPNLNITCRQAINDEARKFNVIDTSGIDDLSAVAAVDVSAQLGDQASKTPNIGAKIASRTADLYEKSLTEDGKTEMFVESTLKSFGLRMHTIDRQTLQTLEKKAEPTGAINIFKSFERFRNAKEAAQKFYKDRIFTAVMDKTERQVPDHKAVLQEIFNRIRKLSHESYKMSSLVVMNETDLNVVKLWQDKGEDYTFAGYDKFDGNNAVIVGDLALIKEYLFGGVNLNAKASAASELRLRASKAAQERQRVIDASGEAAVSGIKGPSTEDLYLAAATQIPLHPLDQITLTDKKYNESVREIMNPVLKGVGAFGDISYIPDDFAYKDKEFSNKEKEYIEENGIPVFRYNTQNPNVLDLKFKFGGIYFAQLKLGYQKEIARLTSAVAEGVLPTGVGTFPIRTRGAAIAYIRSKGFSQGLGDEEKKEIISGLLTRVSPELAKEVDLSSPDAAADSIASILEEAAEKTNLNPLVLVDQQLPGNPNSIMADFTEDLYRKAFQMSITTLPLFHISKLASLNGPCIVFAQDQPITQIARKERTLLNKFFSGLYKIMGFKHTITTSAATSEFKLVKNAPNFKLEED